jgi:hypothetical protein
VFPSSGLCCAVHRIMCPFSACAMRMLCCSPLLTLAKSAGLGILVIGSALYWYSTKDEKREKSE